MKKLKITSMILVAVMLLGMLPLGLLPTFAAAAAPTTLPDGTTTIRTVNYFSGEHSLVDDQNIPNSTKAALWRGAEGILIKMTTGENGAEVNPQLMFGAGQSSKVASYVRAIAASSADKKTSVDVHGYLTSTMYLWDGTAWSSQTTDNLTTTQDMGDNLVLPANFDGYVYVPLDQLWFYGQGNRDQITEDTNPYLFQTNFVEYITKAQHQTVSVNVNNEKVNGGAVGTGTITSIDYVYAINDWAPKANDVYKPIVVTTKSDSDTAFKLDWDGGNKTIVNTLQTTNNCGTLGWQAMSTGKYTDLSNVKGIQVDVDTTAVGANGQVYFRLFFQQEESAANTAYGKDGKGAHLIGSYNKDANGIYQQSADTSYMQYVTRSADSVAYIKDGQGNWKAVYAEGTTYTGNNESAFKLPANYNGPVFIPMNSYYLTLKNNSSPTMIAFEDCLLQYASKIGYAPYYTGTAVKTEITISNYQFVYEAPDKDNTVTLDNADEVLAFFNDPASFSGKNVVLTTDVTFNAGWDAFAETVTAPTTVLAPTSSTFAGTFDGQGHTISGLYLAATANNAGFFGNVAKGTTATVKNLTIVNSYLSNTAGTTGGIFGAVMAESDTPIIDPHYVNTTKAYIDGVYLTANIVNTGNKAGTEAGVGGFIGQCMADADIRNCIFAGTVTSNSRGTAAMIGSVYVLQNASQANLYRTDINLYNNVFSGTLNASGQGFVGAIFGYFNPTTVFAKVDRFYSFGAVNSSAEGKRDGILAGGGWSAANDTKRDGSSKDNSYVILTNIKYAVAGNVTQIMNDLSQGGVKVYINNTFDQFKGKDITETIYPAMATTDIPDVVVIRNALSWKQSVTVTAEGDFKMSIYLKANDIVLKDGAEVVFNVRLGSKASVAETVATEAKLTDDGVYYYVTFDVPMKVAADVFKIELVTGANTVKLANTAFDTRPVFKNYMKAIIDGEYSDELKALAGDILRYADVMCDAYWADTENALAGYTPVMVLADGEADTLPGSKLLTDPVIEGTHFTAVNYDDETGKFTITADANSGACSATFGGKAVTLTLDADGKLSFTLPEDATMFDAAKILVVTNGTSTVSVSATCFMPADMPAGMTEMVAMFASAAACLG